MNLIILNDTIHTKIINIIDILIKLIDISCFSTLLIPVKLTQN